MPIPPQQERGRMPESPDAPLILCVLGREHRRRKFEQGSRNDTSVIARSRWMALGPHVRRYRIRRIAIAPRRCSFDGMQ